MPASQKYMDDLTAQLAASGIQMPQAQPPAAAPGNVLTMPEMTINPDGSVSKPAPLPDPSMLDATPAPKGYSFAPHSQGTVDPGVQLANAGVKSLPEGVGATLPPPPPGPQAAGPMNPGGLVFGGGANGGQHGLQAPKPVTVPAHEVALVDPKRQAQIAAGLDAESAAIGGITAAQRHMAENEGVAQGLRAQAMGDQAQALKDFDAKSQAKLDAMTKTYDDMSKDAANAKIDPEQRWKDMGFGRQMLFTIGNALATFGESLGGAKNRLPEKLQQEIANNIEAQRAAIESKKGRVGDMKGILADAYRRTGDMRQAMGIANAVALDQLDATQKQYAAASNSEMVDAKSQAMSAELRTKKAEELAKLNKYVQAQTVTPGMGKGSVDSKLVVPMGDGKGIVARSEQEAAKIRGRIGARDAITQGLNELKALEGRASFVDRANPMSAFNQEKAAKLAQLRTRTTVFEGQGAMSKGDADNTNEAIGALTGLGQFTGNQTKIIDNAIHGINSSVDTELRSQDGLVVHQGIGADPHGNIQQTWTPSGESYGAQAKPDKPAYTIQPVAPKK